MSATEVIVGICGRAHGVRGEVSVEPRTDEPERRFARGSVLRTDDGRRLTVGQARAAGARWVVGFAEVTDRTAAEALAGVALLADVDADAVPEDPDEFYDRHLIGLEVRRADGAAAGTIVEVQHPGAQDLLVVATPAGQRLVPFVKQVVVELDVAGGYCRLADIGGLLDDEE